MSRWAGKAVMVTGGGSGIGRAVCLRFAREGASVAVVDRAASNAVQTAADIAAAGQTAVPIVADVSSEADVVRAVQETVAAFGRIDVMVNNAAINAQVRVTDVPLAQWNEILATNLTSVYLFCREVIPHMVRQGGGSIVNISSVHALATLDGYAAYAASKGGMIALTKAVALDFAKQGIRVNAVLPGAVHTAMLENSVKNLDTPREQIMQEWNKSQPVGRVGAPEEIAEVVLFAAHPDNSFMTGAALVADGGLTAEL